MATATITEIDVDGFRTKLDHWGAALSPGEQAVLHMILVRAFPDDSGFGDPAPEVEGFATISPRDPQTGLATGKRMHKPYTLNAPYTPSLAPLVGLPYSTTPDELA